MYIAFSGKYFVSDNVLYNHKLLKSYIVWTTRTCLTSKAYWETWWGVEWDNDNGAEKEIIEEGDSRKIRKMDFVVRWKDLYEEEWHNLEIVKQDTLN